jgi:hypothetical protein
MTLALKNLAKMTSRKPNPRFLLIIFFCYIGVLKYLVTGNNYERECILSGLNCNTFTIKYYEHIRIEERVAQYRRCTSTIYYSVPKAYWESLQ